MSIEIDVQAMRIVFGFIRCDVLNFTRDRELQNCLSVFVENFVDTGVEGVEIFLGYAAERGVNSPDAVPIIKGSEEQQRYRAEDEVGEKRSLSGHLFITILA